MSRMHNGGLCEAAALQRAAFCVVQRCCCRGLFSAWNRMVSREHSGGWAPQCTAVLVALRCTPTLFHSCSASDNISISRSISRPCLGCLSYIPPSTYLSLLLYVSSPFFSSPLKLPVIQGVQHRLLCSSLKLPLRSVTYMHTDMHT